MTDSARQADTLLTEHFQYTPLSLIDEIINAVNTIIYHALEAIENGLLSLPPPTLGFGAEISSADFSIRDTDGNGNVEYPEASAEIENGVHQLETLLEATVDKTFDKFEIYTLRNILTVPDELAGWMRLGHYENLPLSLPPTTPTPESLLTLRTRLRETRKLNLALRATRSQNTALLSSLSSILSPPSNPTSPSNLSLAFLTHHPSAATLGLTFTLPSSTSTKPLTTHAAFALSQLPALREKLQELRPKLKTLPEAGARVDWEGKREERRRYIEGRVRKVVGAGDGEGGVEVPGGRGEEEVRGLEGLVGRLKKGGDAEMDG